jgi:L-iditol 2-dehydrogenase
MLQVKMPKAYEFEYLDVPVPAVGDGDVLIKMSTMGICGSDVQVYHGLHNYMTFPVVQGHEGSGVVEKIGDKVTTVKPGDKVTIQPQIFCGECVPCKTGNENVCQNLKVYGIHTDGMAQDYLSMPESVIRKLPSEMSFDVAAFVEPTAVAVGSIRRCGEIKGKNVVVLGAGPIGNLVAQVAVADGANVLITDIADPKLALAKECGIPNVRNTAEVDLKKTIAEVFGDDGADCIIDCAAVTPSLLSALNAARPASKIVIVGNFKKPVEIEIPLIQRQAIDVIGVMMYVRADYEKAISLMNDGKIEVEKITSNSFPIDKFKEAYDFIDENRMDVMKVLMKF